MYFLWLPKALSGPKRSALTLCPGTVIESEPYVGRLRLANGTLGTDKFADLLVKLPAGASYIIDVSIVNPSAASYIQRNQSHRLQHGAAVGREDLKRALYNRVETESGPLINIERFVPFVVDRTGRLGPAAFAFLTQHTLTAPDNPATSHRSTLLKSISFWMALFNGRMVGTTRTRRLQRDEESANGA